MANDLIRPLEKFNERIKQFVYCCPLCHATQFTLISTLPTDDMGEDDMRMGDVYCTQCKIVLDGILTEIDFDMDDELDKFMDEDE